MFGEMDSQSERIINGEGKQNGESFRKKFSSSKYQMFRPSRLNVDIPTSPVDDESEELGVFHDTATDEKLKDWPLMSFSRCSSSDTSGESLFSPPLSGRSRSSSGCGFESGQGSRKSPRHSDLRTPALLSPLSAVQEDGRTSVGATSLSKEFGEWNIENKSPQGSFAQEVTSSNESSVLFNPSSFAVPRRGRSDSYGQDESMSKVDSSGRVNFAFPQPTPTHATIENLMGDDSENNSPSENLFQSHDCSVFSPFPNASTGVTLKCSDREQVLLNCSSTNESTLQVKNFKSSPLDFVERTSSLRSSKTKKVLFDRTVSRSTPKKCSLFGLRRSFTEPYYRRTSIPETPFMPERTLSQSDSYSYSESFVDYSTPQGNLAYSTCGQYGNDWGVTVAANDSDLEMFKAVQQH